MMGCWMELKSDDEEGMIKVKVKDGDIVFPVDAIGDNAVVEGTVYKIDLIQEKVKLIISNIRLKKQAKILIHQL